MSDVAIALRTLRKNPRFSIVAILTIAVGIGACSALFSVYDRLVLSPVTIPQPQTLIAILNNNPQLAAPTPSVSWPRYEYLRDHATAFASIGISAFDNFTITGEGDPDQLNGLRVSPSFLPTLGIVPARGRNFAPEDDQPNGPRVVLISHELWTTRFGGRDDVVGRPIQLNGQPWEVIGITPARLSSPFGQVQIFAPRVFDVGGLTLAQVQNGAGYAQPIARLAPGKTMDDARREMAAISQSYRESFGARLDAQNVNEPQAFVDFLVGGLRPTFYTLLGAVAFVLLIACANVASLFLGRLASRHREIAVRQSLGAVRGRVVRQLVTESVVFSAMAGGFGVLLGMWALSATQSMLSSQLPPNATLAMNWRALAFAAAVTLLSALVVGVAPALHASRTDLVEALKDRTRGSSERTGRFRSVLIVVEVALSVVLLVGSSLLLLSFVAMQRTPLGFNPTGLATAFVGIPPRYQTPAQQSAFFTDVIERLRADGRVTGAAAAVGLPLSGFNPRSPYSVAGRPILPLAQRPLAGLVIVSDGYFEAMGITLSSGRTFTASDRQGTPGVCIINEPLARRLFPGESALGKVLLRGRDAEVPQEIVGVVREVKTLGVNAPPVDEVYLAMRQIGRPSMSVVARTVGDPAGLQGAMRAAVTAVDKDQPLSFFSTMDSNIAASLGVQRIVASLTGAFAALALVMSAVGLYSVLAHVVTQRTSEIGIRMALGAQASQVVGLIMRSGLRLVAIGLVAGLLASAGAAHLIRTLLFQVQPLDVRIYAGVAGVFAVIAVLACWIPSYRASRIDPLLALRPE